MKATDISVSQMDVHYGHYVDVLIWTLPCSGLVWKYALVNPQDTTIYFKSTNG